MTMGKPSGEDTERGREEERKKANTMVATEGYEVERGLTATVLQY